MRKKLGLGLLTVGLIALGVLLFSAFESYVLNVRAHVAPALNVFPHGTWDLGNVFPEEDFVLEIQVGVSKSFQAEPNVRSLSYAIGCTPRNEVTPSICQNITWDVDGQHLGRLRGQNAHRDSLDKEDKEDVYRLNFVVPDCVDAHQKEEVEKELPCGMQGIDVASSISVRVLDINRIRTKQPEPKAPQQFQFKLEAPKGGPYNRLTIEVPKNIQLVQVHRIHATIKNDRCDPETVKGAFKDHLKDVNPEDPYGLTDHEVWSFQWPTACIRRGETVVVAFTLTSAGHASLKDKAEDAGVDVKDLVTIKRFRFSVAN